MYYATAGQQAAQRGSSGGAIPIGGGAFPPITAIGRGGPPGFVARGAGEWDLLKRKNPFITPKCPVRSMY